MTRAVGKPVRPFGFIIPGKRMVYKDFILEIPKSRNMF